MVLISVPAASKKTALSDIKFRQQAIVVERSEAVERLELIRSKRSNCSNRSRASSSSIETELSFTIIIHDEGQRRSRHRRRAERFLSRRCAGGLARGSRGSRTQPLYPEIRRGSAPGRCHARLASRKDKPFQQLRRRLAPALRAGHEGRGVSPGAGAA